MFLVILNCVVGILNIVCEGPGWVRVLWEGFCFVSFHFSFLSTQSTWLCSDQAGFCACTVEVTFQ